MYTDDMSGYIIIKPWCWLLHTPVRKVDGFGWVFMVARLGLPGEAGSQMNGPHASPPGDHKGPLHIHPSALAPTESWVGA